MIMIFEQQIDFSGYTKFDIYTKSEGYVKDITSGFFRIFDTEEEFSEKYPFIDISIIRDREYTEIEKFDDEIRYFI